MSTIAILPVKTFAAAKQRLAPALGAGSRRALVQAMLADVLASVRRVRGVDELAVVTSDADAEAAARAVGARVLRDADMAGQSRAALIGIGYALRAGFERVLLVPGDTPLLDPAEVEALLERAPAVAIVPDRHLTGTNALVLSPPDAVAPSFGPGSLERHVTGARDAGVRHSVEKVPTLMLDVDTPEDLAELGRTLERHPGRAPSTRDALRQLARRPAFPAPGTPARASA